MLNYYNNMTSLFYNINIKQFKLLTQNTFQSHQDNHSKSSAIIQIVKKSLSRKNSLSST